MSSRFRDVVKLPSPALVVALLALVVAIGGVAIAAIPGPDGAITSCYANSNGALRVIDASGSCESTETRLVFNQTGPRGETGPTGAPGPAGPAGAKGDPGPTTVALPRPPAVDFKPPSGNVPKDFATPPKKPGPKALKDLKGKDSNDGEPTEAFESHFDKVKDVPVLDDATSEVGHVFVPPGRYFVIARATIGVGQGSGDILYSTPSVRCRLVVGSSVEQRTINVYREELVLLMSGHVKSPSRISLRCYNVTYSAPLIEFLPASIGFIRMTAVSLARFKRTELK